MNDPADGREGVSGWQRIGAVLLALPVIGLGTYMFVALVGSLPKTASSATEAWGFGGTKRGIFGGTKRGIFGGTSHGI